LYSQSWWSADLAVIIVLVVGRLTVFPVLVIARLTILPVLVVGRITILKSWWLEG